MMTLTIPQSKASCKRQDDERLEKASYCTCEGPERTPFMAANKNDSSFISNDPSRHQDGDKVGRMDHRSSWSIGDATGTFIF